MSYEFNDVQNKTVTQLALYMKVTAYLTVILGIVDLINGVLSQQWLYIFASISIIVLGVVFYFPVDNLERIVSTQGSDIEELMQAFSDLNKGWTVVIIFLFIAAVFSSIGWFM